MSTSDKLQENLNRLLGNGAITSVTFDEMEDQVSDDGDPEKITITFENGRKITIQAWCLFDGCGDLDHSVLFIEEHRP